MIPSFTYQSTFITGRELQRSTRPRESMGRAGYIELVKKVIGSEQRDVFLLSCNPDFYTGLDCTNESIFSRSIMVMIMGRHGCTKGGSTCATE